MANGLLTNTELVDSLISDLNSLVKDMASGQYVHFCIGVHNMVQKLLNLKSGIQSDIDNKNKTIESLKETIKSLGADVEDVSIEDFVQKYHTEKKDGARDADK